MTVSVIRQQLSYGTNCHRHCMPSGPIPPKAPSAPRPGSHAGWMSKNVYTHGHHESVLRSHTWRTAENSAAYLLSHVVAGMDLLDVGCGPGTITLDLAKRVAPGRVVGIDAAESVLE